jgi:hypothetical protein
VRRYVPLSRRTPLRSRPTDKTGRPSRETRELVQARDSGRCVVYGRGGLLHLHHRQPAGAGGSRNPEIHAAANLVCVCAGSHRRIYNRPAWARGAALLLPVGADPQTVPVRICGGGTNPMRPMSPSRPGLIHPLDRQAPAPDPDDRQSQAGWLPPSAAIRTVTVRATVRTRHSACRQGGRGEDTIRSPERCHT